MWLENIIPISCSYSFIVLLNLSIVVKVFVPTTLLPFVLPISSIREPLVINLHNVIERLTCETRCQCQMQWITDRANHFPLMSFSKDTERTPHVVIVGAG